MKLKEVSKITAGETCAVCFDELGGSTKAVTETPFSHIFHTDCLLPSAKMIQNGPKVEQRESGPIPEGTHVEEVTLLNPGMSFRLRLSLLFDRSRWQNVASGILDHFTFNSEVYAHLLQDLYIHGVDWAEMTSRNGRTRLDVAIEVLERIHIDITPLFPAEPESMPPLEEASVGKSKELSEIAAGETCAICFEEFGGSRKAVTETRCSHIFHTDCLLGWLSRASTCPLCRSSIG